MDPIEQPKDYYESKVDTTEAGGLAFVCLLIIAITAAIWAAV